MKNECNKENKRYIICIGLIFIFLISIPIIKQGITCNDELQLRLLRKTGLGEFFRVNFNTSLKNGRLLGALFSTKILSYVSSNIFACRIVDFVMILITVSAGMFLIHTITEQKNFACFTEILLLAFIPITYEHTVPNAFISVMCVPMTLLYISLGLLIKGIKKHNRKFFNISMILFFFALVMYEFAITYSPFYWIAIFAYSYNENNSILQHVKNKWRTYLTPVFVSCIYLFLYIGSRKVFGAEYAGNSVGAVSLKESIIIIKQLVCSSIPGYYYFNDKYKYLMQVDNGQVSIENFCNARVVLVLCCFLILYWWITGLKSEKAGKTNRIVFLLAAMLAMVLPTLPIAVAQGYQGAVNSEQYIALPVSFCVYFATVTAMSIILWSCIQRFKVVGKIAIGFGLSIILIQIQIMNNGFSSVQYEYCLQLESQEKAFETNLFKELEMEELYAPDLFEQHRNLAFHLTYWSDYSEMVGLNTKVINKCGEQGDWKIFSQKDNALILTNDEKVYLIVDTKLEGDYEIEIGQNSYKSVKLLNGIKDNEKYIYRINDAKEVNE